MSEILINIISTSYDDFCVQVEKFLADSKFSTQNKVVKQYLESLPKEDLINYTYKPCFNSFGIETKFHCKQGHYQLKIQKRYDHCLEDRDIWSNKISDFSRQDDSPIVYQGPINDECLSKISNSNMRETTSKYQNKDFPYTAEISNNGDVTIGGSVNFVGETLNLSNPEDLARFLAKVKK